METVEIETAAAEDLSSSAKRSKVDPFPSRLRCEILPPGTSPERILLWFSPDPYIPVAAEQALLPLLLRWGAKERKMMKDQSPFRLPQIKKKCHQHQVPLLVALSLRRHHIKQLNPYRSMEQLHLGNQDIIRVSADLFERAVEESLQKHRVSFYTEEEQKKHNAKRKANEPYPPTPDFLLKQPVLLRKYKENSPNHPTQRKTQHVLEERCIHWIEVKMFYGASTIEHDGKSAVGAILDKCRRYVDLYGEGAIVFLYGCGDQLARDLAAIRVSVLDAGGAKRHSSVRKNRLCLQALQAHQRTYCSDESGSILI
ncbi:hypothetical protein FisN_15Hh264 [Fistulifera solaris]|uniref:Uncharacterized protein n=1 Tax=Fistulifera solaris TaxID=1519565 RepID=A0A1Z5JFK2_FISSO|nr:hypothetical protein FisN_15Hh264 [Fistulifera solaris]|eukprot:GAX12785.1 hypothetical protein FisN_15Hh264 [Fistulifera solaris]